MTKIAFLGDISLNGRYRIAAAQNENPFAEIQPILQQADFVTGNLESFTAGDDGVNERKIPRLTTDIKTLGYLKMLNLDLAFLANNHAFDHLQSGFRYTTETLDRLGIQYMGAGWGQESRHIKIVELQKKRTAFLNYAGYESNPNLPEATPFQINMLQPEVVLSDIAEAKAKADFVILSLHWGTEHNYYPSAEQRILATNFIRAGADLIIGHHTHSLQPYEVIDGKFVFYSLGNFCFDDIETNGKVWEIDRKMGCESLIVLADISGETIKIDFQPVRNSKIDIVPDKSVLKKFRSRFVRFHFMRNFPPLLKLTALYYRYIYQTKFYFTGNDRKFFRQLLKLSPAKIFRFLKG